MVRLRLDSADLARVRVAGAMHPAGTAMLASQMLRDPHAAAGMPALARRAADAAPRLRLFHHLVPRHGILPDFLTPWDGVESLDAGLDAIRAAARHRIRSEVAAAYTRMPVTALRRRFAAADPEVLDALVAATGRYFEEVLAPHWPALEQQHRHEAGRLAGRFARGGVEGVLNGLPAGLRWRSPVLEVETGRDREIAAGGRGIVLVPSPFAGPRPRLLLQEGRPVLVVFRSGGIPDLDPAPGGDGIDRLLGRTRAAVLRRVTGPGRHTTSTVAGQVGISVSSASEHLTVLRAAGLVTSHRDGGAVDHRATPLGAAVLRRGRRDQ